MVSLGTSRAFADLKRISIGRDTRSSRSYQAEVVMAGTNMREHFDPNDPVLSIDTQSKYTDPAVVEYVEAFKRRLEQINEVRPQALADNKHSTILTGTSQQQPHDNTMEQVSRMSESSKRKDMTRLRAAQAILAANRLPPLEYALQFPCILEDIRAGLPVVNGATQNYASNVDPHLDFRMPKPLGCTRANRSDQLLESTTNSFDMAPHTFQDLQQGTTDLHVTDPFVRSARQSTLAIHEADRLVHAAQESTNDTIGAQHLIQGLQRGGELDTHVDQQKAATANRTPTTDNPVQSAWIKHKDMPKGAPDNKSESTLTGHTFSSSGGWDRGLLQDVAIGDWNGGLATPVPDWEARAGYEDNQPKQTVSRWIDAVEKALETVEREVPMVDYQRYLKTPAAARDSSAFDEAYWSRTIVPDYWMQLKFGHQSPLMFWREHKASRNPPPCDEGELDAVNPWWIAFPPHVSPFLQEFKHPEIRGIDPDETRALRMARANDHGSNDRARAWRAMRQRDKKDRSRILNKATKAIAQPASHLFQPATKMLVRPPIRDDMHMIASLLNRHIRFGVAIPTTELYTEQDAKEICNNRRDRDHLVLVACEPSYTIKPSNKYRTGADLVMPEKVVGFAFVSDHIPTMTPCPHTRLINVFTAHESYKKGVATCLVDKMLKALNTQHTEITACEADIPTAKDADAPHAAVKHVLIQFLWDHTQPEKLAWTSDWLSKRFGFWQSMTLPGVASKLDTVVNQTTFHKTFK